MKIRFCLFWTSLCHFTIQNELLPKTDQYSVTVTLFSGKVHGRGMSERFAAQWLHCGPGLTSGYVAVSVYHIVGKPLGPYIEAEISSAITFVFIKLNH